jgi:ArsR family transcriptional regulator
MDKPYENQATVFKAFADASRLLILDRLRSGEQCASDLLARLPIAQSTLSHHMGLLVGSGIVLSRRDGKATYYRISEAGCKAAADFIAGIASPAAVDGRRRQKSKGDG